MPDLRHLLGSPDSGQDSGPVLCGATDGIGVLMPTNVDCPNCTARMAVANVVEALAVLDEVAYMQISGEKSLTVQPTGKGRARIPAHWREETDIRVRPYLDFLREALSPAGITDLPDLRAEVERLQSEMSSAYQDGYDKGQIAGLNEATEKVVALGEKVGRIDAALDRIAALPAEWRLRLSTQPSEQRAPGTRMVRAFVETATNDIKRALQDVVEPRVVVEEGEMRVEPDDRHSAMDDVMHVEHPDWPGEPEYEFAIANARAPEPHHSNTTRFDTAEEPLAILNQAETGSGFKVLRRVKPGPWEDLW